MYKKPWEDLGASRNHDYFLYFFLIDLKTTTAKNNHNPLHTALCFIKYALYALNSGQGGSWV